MKTGMQLWAGSEHAYQTFIEGMCKAEASANFKADGDYEQAVLAKAMHIDNGIAVISIAGSLIDGSAGYGIYYGYMGYNDIRNALAAAVADSSVGSILLNVGSGGGAVSGCHECSQLIARVNKIKPVVTYTGSQMSSAALWLGSQAEYVVAGQTASVGSLGIIMVHADRTEQLKQSGVKATVIRAGSEKALASPYEVLSEKAIANLQGQANDLYKIFLVQVAGGRKVSAQEADDNFGQGRDFLGKAALKAGLVDSIGTYEDAMAKAQSLMKKRPTSSTVKTKYGATNTSIVQASALDGTLVLADNLANPEGTQMTVKQALTAEHLAAMAAGVDLPEEKPALTAAEQLAADTAAAAAKLAEEAAQNKPEAGKPAVEALAGGTQALVSEAVTVLQGMLADANAKLMTVTMEAKVATDALATAQAQASGFTEIARNSVRTMGLHFGITKEAAAVMSATEVLAEHGRLAGLFQAKFKVGGVAATSPGTSAAEALAPTMTPSQLQSAMKLPRSN